MENGGIDLRGLVGYHTETSQKRSKLKRLHGFGWCTKISYKNDLKQFEIEKVASICVVY